MRKNIPLRRILSGAGLTVAVLAVLAACGGGGSGGGSSGNPGQPTPPTQTANFSWNGYARDGQHSDLAPTLAQGGITAQDLGQIAWEVPIDTNVDNTVPIHYGSPMITSNNTVLVAVKTQTDGGFQMQAHSAAKGALVWSANSDYVLPPHGWIPSFGSTLTPGNRLYMPGSGGKVFYTDSPDSATGSTMKTAVFYGASNYAGASSTYDGTVFINTPITSDSSGNIFFGFVVTGSNPAGLTSGFARIGADGSTTWVPAPAMAGATGTGSIATAPTLNAAPGISNDGKTVYVSVHEPLITSNSDVGFLLALDSTTLATNHSVRLMDPVAGTPAWVSDDATASPVIGPDGDVYYGVLEANFPNHNARGWLLHFDATLATSKTPGSFGWDDTPSIVPASLVASYHGTSSYLLMSKYNNYAGAGTGDGKNKMAILDPNTLETDPVAGNAVMNEVLTVLGPTADTASGFAGAVREWCVNSAAVDPNGKAIFINSEDGKLYRWDLTVGTLTQSIWLDNGYGQAYTPTAIGPDGTVYSINNGTLIAVTK